jgi:hypothetical protein
MTTLLPQTLDGIVDFAAIHQFMMIAIDPKNDEFDAERIQNYHGETEIAVVDCASEKRLTERQLLQRWCAALLGYVPMGNAYDLIKLLNRRINEFQCVTVFLNPQCLCKKSGGVCSSIEGPVETIRRIWDETNAPVVFCCSNGFVDAINGKGEEARDAGNSFRWRSGGFVDLT